MAKINWSARSLQDLKEIGDYIGKDSPRFARLTLEKLMVTVELLKENPLLGRIVPEVGRQNIRDLVVGSYRIIHYLKSKNNVTILTVHHTSRLLSNNPAMRRYT